MTEEKRGNQTSCTDFQYPDQSHDHSTTKFGNFGKFNKFLLPLMQDRM